MTWPIKHNVHMSKVARRHSYRLNTHADYRLDMAERVTNFEGSFFKEFVKSLRQEDFITYPCLHSMDLLRQKIAVHNDLESPNVFLGNGSCSVIKNIFHLVCTQGSNIVTSEPAFPMYEVYAHIMGADVKKVPYSTDLTVPFEAITEAVDDNTRVVVLANPNSPLGDWKNEEEIMKLWAFLYNRGILLLLDEAYVEYAPRSFVSHIAQTDNLVIVRTLSKAFGGAGCRLGYALASPTIINLLEKIGDPYSISQSSLKFALHLFDNPHVVKKYVSQVIKEKKLLEKKLKKHDYDIVSGFCNWVHFNDSSNNKRALSILDKHSICYRKKTQIPHDYRDNWIRLTIAPNASTQDYIKELLTFKS